MTDNKPPDERSLRILLGSVFGSYQKVLALAEGHEKTWKFYGQKYGWSLKVMGKGKALFYLTPKEGSFGLGFGLRSEERDSLLKSALPADVRKELESAKKFQEGYPLRLSVAGPSDMKPVQLVIMHLKSMRASGGKK